MLYNEEIIGFFCCSGDCIKLKTKEKKEADLHEKPVREVPAMKIGRLGRDKKYKGQNVVSLILHWAVGYIQNISEHVGIRYITVDSYPNKIEWYRKNGFIQNQHKDYKEREHASMRYDLYNPPKK